MRVGAPSTLPAGQAQIQRQSGPWPRRRVELWTSSYFGGLKIEHPLFVVRLASSALATMRLGALQADPLRFEETIPLKKSAPALRGSLTVIW